MNSVLFVLCLATTFAGLAAERPLVLENEHLSLRFDPRTGNWMGLVDRRTG
jgi:hypothetical protein